MLTHGPDGAVLQFIIIHHLHERRILFSQILNIQQITVAHSGFVEEHHAFFIIQTKRIKAKWIFGIAEIEFVLALGCADFVIVNFMQLVLAAVCALRGSIVGAVIEAVAMPGSIGEFAPDYMILKMFAALEVEYIDFGPVAAASRDGIGHIFAVLGDAGAGKCHRAVI